MRFPVPDSSSSLDLTSDSQPAVFDNEHQSSMAQESMRDHFETGDAGEGPWVTEDVPISTPPLSQQPQPSTRFNTKMKKGTGLRKRISKFFIGPHSASLEPRRIINDIPPSATALNYLLIKLPGHMRQPNTFERQPFDASPDQRMFLDRSNLANHTGVGKHGNPAQSRDAPTGHHRFSIRTRLFARPSPSVALPLGCRQPQLPEADYATHNGENIRSNSSDDLYRKAPRRRSPRSPQSRRNLSLDLLSTQEQVPQQLSRDQAHDTVSPGRLDDWPHWYWPATSSEPLKIIPASNIGARQLALLDTGHRGGVIIRNSSTPPAKSISQMTTMDMENLSQEWRPQHQFSGSVADANAEFEFQSRIDNVEEETEHRNFSFSNTIDISPDPHNGALPFKAGSRSSSYYSGRGLDAALKAARQRNLAASSTLPRSTRSTSLPLIPTGSDIIQAAAANPEVDEMPMAFRAYFEDDGYDSSGERSGEQHGMRVMSRSQVLTPLPQDVREGNSEHKHEHEGRGRFELTYESESADEFQKDLDSGGGLADNLKATPIVVTRGDTARLLDLVRTLKDERDGLLQQNQELLAVAKHAKGLLEGAEEAYDAVEKRAGLRIEELEVHLRALQKENDRLKGRLN